MQSGEKGQALPLAMLALAIGSLVITPFLGHASSSLIGSGAYEQGLAELYSCDSGIEYAIWGLMSGTLEVTENATEALPRFSINNKTVDVTVENLGANIYLLTSTATSDDGHSTAVTSYVQHGGGGWSSEGNIDDDVVGDVFIDNDANIDGNVTVDGSLYATGDVEMANNAEITGDVVAGGALELFNNAVIGGDVSTGGDLRLNNNSEIGSIEVGGNVCAGGNVYLENNTVINGSVYITGSVTSKIQLANNARIYGDVYATGTINNIVREQNILGDVYEEYAGAYPPPPDCLTMPDPGGTGIVSWD
ncbi:MAG: polymer-forming cytoskeletal protein [Chloroflexota bacterium]